MHLVAMTIKQENPMAGACAKTRAVAMALVASSAGIPGSPGNYASRRARNDRPRLCRRWAEPVPSRLLLGADLCGPLRAGAHRGSRTLSSLDRIRPGH